VPNIFSGIYSDTTAPCCWDWKQSVNQWCKPLLMSPWLRL
jgi:hypothetical protein